jgi:hypothetical protein
MAAGKDKQLPPPPSFKSGAFSNLDPTLTSPQSLPCSAWAVELHIQEIFRVFLEPQPSGRWNQFDSFSAKPTEIWS